MRTSPAVPMLLLLGCATLPPWRAADPAQAGSSASSEAAATVAGVSVRARVGDWRSWPERLQDRITPVEVVIQNDGPSALEIRPERFRLERQGAAALPALSPGELPRALGPVVLPRDPDLLAWGGPPGPPGLVPSLQLYDWPGLSAARPARPLTAHGPDPRPAPLGTLETSRSANFMIYFDAPADRLDAFTVVVELVGPQETPLGTLRFPFRR